MRAAGVFRSVRMARKMCSVEMYSSLRRLASSLARSIIRFTRGVMKICPAPPPKILALGLARRVASSRSVRASGLTLSFSKIWGITPPGCSIKRQQDVFGIDLVVAVALDDLRSALGGFLCSFGKSVKSHHRECSFSTSTTTLVIDPLTVFLDLQVQILIPSKYRGTLEIKSPAGRIGPSGTL